MSASHVPAISFDAATSKYTVINRGNGKSIETTVTDKASVADEWVQDIINKYNNVTDQASSSVVDDNSLLVDDNSLVKLVAVGLDVKCSRHDNNVNPATLQLCIDDKCLILQLLYMDQFPYSLKSFFMDSKFAFVGVNVENNISMINARYGLKVKNRIDVTVERMCFHDVAVMLQGKPPSGWMSDWEARILSLDQVQFACLDSYVSYLLCASI
ncbi:hypothetical protein QN277_025613 [Acacia crassicarpa]|uniref:3'-5' exonuclease domain-containing protein n=1 Tax=Acacia crassicarpa TaxID=499986 RepID=A0AAE1JA78_9FABA|nr:hypothetical protein QN277_025613 [Acacia crassicarpa]